MFRSILLAAALVLTLALALSSTPSLAVTAKDKQATCRFGADNFGPEHKKLTGKARTNFINKCMSGKDDPRGPATSGAPATQPAEEQPPEEQ